MKDISLIDLKSSIDDLPYPTLNTLFSLCTFPSSQEKTQSVIKQYEESKSSDLLGIKVDDEIIGLLGIKITKSTGKIKHIGILSEYQKQGIGSKIIKMLPLKYNLNSLEAETDNEAVGFYRRLEFAVIEIQDTLYPTPRFFCKLKV